MESYPWQTELVKYKFGLEYNECKIEEINTPWDLLLESRILKTTLGGRYHVDLIRANKERLFSIRNKNREPLADIITMPPGTNRLDGWWAKMRRLKTSSPMTIDGQKLVILDVIEEKEKPAGKDYIQLVEMFFQSYGGVLNNEHQHFWVSLSKKELRKIKHSDKSLLVNLVISSTLVYPDEPFRATNMEEVVALLEQDTYNDICFNANDVWMEEAIEFILRTPSNWPKGKWRVCGALGKQQYYIDKINKVIQA